MAESNRRYGLLSELSGVEETRNAARQRNLPLRAPLTWLAKGWRDLLHKPWLSLSYGAAIYAVTIISLFLLIRLGWDYILFPALAGFLIVGPVLAFGLYEKSRAIERGEEPTLARMVFVQPRTGTHIFFMGLLLCFLMLLWNRAAVLLYALFFGVRPFPGLDQIAYLIAATPEGLGLAVVGSLIGSLFAAFAFAISVFAVPMMLDQRVDTLTAMAVSFATVWNNLLPMIMWGFIVSALLLLSLATGIVGLIVVFPLLGHATWHGYKALT